MSRDDWSRSLTWDEVEGGSELPPISIPITLQRLVMEAGANRDLSLIHHDGEVARATGAPDAYANAFFIVGMFERLLREWMGVAGRLRAIRQLRMQVFNSVGDLLTCRGRVREKGAEGAVVIELWCESEKGVTVTAEGTVELPLASGSAGGTEFSVAR